MTICISIRWGLWLW